MVDPGRRDAGVPAIRCHQLALNDVLRRGFIPAKAEDIAAKIAASTWNGWVSITAGAASMFGQGLG